MKTILVIEEPNECIDCPCYRQTKEDGELFEDCKAMMMPLNWREVTEKPSWCPLKPLPQEVDSIPIDWIKEWCKDEPYWTNLGMQLIDDWRLEHESHISD